MKSYLAKICHENSEVEGEILLSIEGVDLLCFSYFSMPHDVKIEQFYQIELTPFIVDDYFICEVSDDTPVSMTRIDDTLSYVIIGRLNGNCVDVDGIEFEDDILQSDFGYLDGKMVSWKIDRIDAEFLSDLPSK